jgi:hypothetical protein
VVERLHVKQDCNLKKHLSFPQAFYPSVQYQLEDWVMNISVSSVAIASEISANFCFSLYLKLFFLLR